MTIEDMKQGISKIRNPVIARVFRELNLIEQWGSGVRRMFKEAEEQGLPAPEFMEIGMRVRFIVRLATPIAIGSSSAQVEAQKSGVESGVESGAESTMVLQILGSLRNARLSKADIARQLGKAKPNRYLNELMSRLLQAGYVEYTIPDKPNSRLQKYRRTAKGEILLQNKDRLES